MASKRAQKKRSNFNFRQTHSERSANRSNVNFRRYQSRKEYYGQG